MLGTWHRILNHRTDVFVVLFTIALLPYVYYGFRFVRPKVLNTFTMARSFFTSAHLIVGSLLKYINLFSMAMTLGVAVVVLTANV